MQENIILFRGMDEYGLFLFSGDSDFFCDDSRSFWFFIRYGDFYGFRVFLGLFCFVWEKICGVDIFSFVKTKKDGTKRMKYENGGRNKNIFCVVINGG